MSARRAGSRGGSMSSSPKKTTKSSSKKKEKEKAGTQEFIDVYEVRRLQDRVEELVSENRVLRELSGGLSARVEKNKDIETRVVTLLDDKLQKSEEQVKIATSERDHLTNELKSQKRAHEEQVQVLEAKHERESKALEARCQEFKEKYETLQRFEEEKERMEAQIEKLKRDMTRAAARHERRMDKVLRRNLVENENLKNEMLRKIRDTKFNLLNMTENQLHTTTKRTIMENEQMTTELQYQSKETEKIVRKNTRLLAVCRHLRHELQLVEDANARMAVRSTKSRRLVTKLTQKVRDLEKVLEVRDARISLLESQIRKAADGVAQNRGLREALAALQQRYDALVSLQREATMNSLAASRPVYYLGISADGTHQRESKAQSSEADNDLLAESLRRVHKRLDDASWNETTDGLDGATANEANPLPKLGSDVVPSIHAPTPFQLRSFLKSYQEGSAGNAAKSNDSGTSVHRQALSKYGVREKSPMPAWARADVVRTPINGHSDNIYAQQPNPQRYTETRTQEKSDNDQFHLPNAIIQRLQDELFIVQTRARRLEAENRRLLQSSEKTVVDPE